MLLKSISKSKAAETLGVSERTIYRLVLDNLIVGFHVRKSLRITMESLRRYQDLQIKNFRDNEGIVTDDDSQ